MMGNGKKYIQIKGEELGVGFNSISKIEYEFDIDEKLHILKVHPKSYFIEENDTFIIKQHEIILEFQSKFPYENICFISDGDLIDFEGVPSVLYKISN